MKISDIEKVLLEQQDELESLEGEVFVCSKVNFPHFRLEKGTT